jgi:hypothetical protein
MKWRSALGHVSNREQNSKGYEWYPRVPMASEAARKWVTDLGVLAFNTPAKPAERSASAEPE